MTSSLFRLWRRLAGTLLALLVCAIFINPPAAHAAGDYVVTTTDDSGNVDCATELGGSGIVGSLRFMICKANSDPSGGTIRFDLPAMSTIAIVSNPLPPITVANVSIDATLNSAGKSVGCPVRATQKFPLVGIDGSSLPSSTGLIVAPGVVNVQVTGLSVTGFKLGIQWGGNQGTLICNWVGLSVTGSAKPNAIGIALGGDTPAAGGQRNGLALNVVAFNTSHAVMLDSASLNIIKYNEVTNNGGLGYSLLDSDKNLIVGDVSSGLPSTITNNSGGIAIYGGSDNVIGDAGLTLRMGNHIEANTNFGVQIQPHGRRAAFRNTILGNDFGAGNGSFDIDLVPTAGAITVGVSGGTCVATRGNNWAKLPTITSAVTSGGTTTVSGVANPLSLVEIYTTTGVTGGQPLGRTTANARGAFTVIVPGTPTALRATSTLHNARRTCSYGATSEFSAVFTSITPGTAASFATFDLAKTAHDTNGDLAFTAPIGGIIHYDIEAENGGNLGLTNIQMSDLLPKGTTLVPNSAVCQSDSGKFSLCAVVKGKTLVFGLASLQPGKKLNISYDATVSSKLKPNVTLVNSIGLDKACITPNGQTVAGIQACHTQPKVIAISPLHTQPK